MFSFTPKFWPYLTRACIYLFFTTSVASHAQTVIPQNDILSLNKVLKVPVYPQISPQQMPHNIPLQDALEGSYIFLDDGAVLSLADWIIGGLSKNNIKAGASDYDMRLFLGKPALSMLKQSTNKHFQNAASQSSFLNFNTHKWNTSTYRLPSSEASKVFNINTHGIYATIDPTGSSSGYEITLLEDPYLTAFSRAVDDFKEYGIYQKMIRDYKAMHLKK